MLIKLSNHPYLGSFPRLIVIFLILLGMFGFQSIQVVHAASVLYVQPSGLTSGICASWASACELQYALSLAVSGDEIWVATGIYYPTGVNERSTSFVLLNNIGIFGGFNGTETLRSQRNPAVNVTILSGDIDTVGNISDNSYHVVNGSGTNGSAVLDGFTITGGNAVDDTLNPYGGGILNVNGSPTLSNLVIDANTAFYGGGVFNITNSSPTLTNITISENSAVRGGGIYNSLNSNPILTNVTFNANTASTRGGGVANSGSAPTLINVTFSGNVSSLGGGIHNVTESNPILINVTFSGNSASTDGGGIYNNENSNPIITSSILFGNTGGEIFNENSAPVVTYSIIQGGYIGQGNLDADPLLGALQHNGGPTQTMALGAGSPAIDAGEDMSCPAFDQRGVTRPKGAHCDIGAYEYEASSTPTPVNTAINTPTSIPTSTPTFTPTNTFTPTATVASLNNPLYLSLTGNQTIGGVASADEDILKFDGTNWSLFFDGSDVGVGSSDLFGFSVVDSDTLLMAFSSAVTVNGLTVNPQDVVRFEATLLGTNTTGTFYMYLDGSDVGLDTTAEKIDSVSLLADGRVLISTTGNPAVVSITGAKDEDVLAFTPISLGDVTSGNWTMYFDGSDVGLAETSGEDVDALEVVNGKIYLSTADNFSVNGVAGADEDIFYCNSFTPGDVTTCSYSSALYFDGSTWNLSANDVDAFNFLALGTVPPSTPTNTPTNTPTATKTPTLIVTGGPSLTPSHTPTNTSTATATFTPTVTSTPGSSDLIFADGFESGNFSSWIANTNDLGDLSVSGSAGLVGSQGMGALIDDANTIYVTDDSPNVEPRYRTRFYFDPNSIPMASGDAHFIFKGFMGTSTEVLRLEFRNSSGAYQIRAALLDDGTTWINTNWFTITDATHFLELDWRAATAVGSNNGGLTLWIDGIQQVDLTGIDNDTRRLDRARLGALTGIDAGTRGTYYFDAFESRQLTYIGP